MTEKRKRARTAKGRYKADDPKTPFINEAYETVYTKKDYVITAVILLALVGVFWFSKI